MQLHELVLQGIRSFDQLYRLPIGQGLSVFVGGPGSGKSTVLEVLLELFDPTPLEEDAGRFAATGGGECRAALLFSDQRGTLYRLVRDFGRGAMVLSQRSGPEGQFVNISTAAAEIRQYLGGQVSLPQRDLWRELFFTRADSFPSSQRPQEQQSAPPQVSLPAAGLESPRPATAFFKGYQGDDLEQQERLPEDPQEIQRQIETLRRDLELARQVDELQFEADGLRQQLFEAESKTRQLNEAQNRLKELERQRQEFARLRDLPQDFEQKVRAYGEEEKRLSRALSRLEEEENSFRQKFSRRLPPPLKSDPVFLSGLGVGLGALALGGLGFVLDESLRWAALMDLPAFAVALVAYLRHLDAWEGGARLEARLKQIEQRKERARQEFEMATALVRKIMKEQEVEKAETLLELYARAGELEKSIGQARQELEKMKADPGVLEAQQKAAQLKERIAQLEAKLAGAGGLMMSPKEMERRIKLLEDRLQGGAGQGEEQNRGEDGAPVEFGGGPPRAALGKMPPAALAPSSVEATDDQKTTGAGREFWERLMRSADDVFLTKREDVEAAITPRAGQILVALSGARLKSVTFGPGGIIECAGQEGSRRVEELSAADQDLVYLALKFAILERACARERIPLFFDEPFRSIQQSHYNVMGKALQYLGKFTQVVLLSGDEFWAQFATGSYRLGRAG
jgi:hypothetical protein